MLIEQWLRPKQATFSNSRVVNLPYSQLSLIQLMATRYCARQSKCRHFKLTLPPFCYFRLPPNLSYDFSIGGFYVIVKYLSQSEGQKVQSLIACNMCMCGYFFSLLKRIEERLNGGQIYRKINNSIEVVFMYLSVFMFGSCVCQFYSLTAQILAN